jgi:hypothetical protein
MNSPIQSSPAQHISWQWPVDITAYDRKPLLSESEREALESRFDEVANQQVKQSVKAILHRLLQPIEDVLTFLDARPNTLYDTMRNRLLGLDGRRMVRKYLLGSHHLCPALWQELRCWKH